jgi:nucleoid-associated protein YgaU
VARSAAAPTASAGVAGSKAAETAQRPEFDVVRVEPSGDIVVAGRAAPQAKVAVMSGETKIAEVAADANGQFVVLPPKLAPGSHLLTLRSDGAQGAAASEQSVAVAVPAKPGQTSIAVLTAPDKPTVVLAAPPAAPGIGSVAVAPKVAVLTAEAGEEGAFFASGTAPPHTAVQLYLNNSPVARVTADPDGKWSLRVGRGMTSGHYEIRADALDGTTGKVVSRAGVPFDFPSVKEVRAAPAVTLPAPAPALPPVLAERVATPPPPPAGPPVAEQPAASVSEAFVPEIQSVTVVRGDNLWRISRRILGRGVRYTQIYEANSSQIRDPNLIWPGQILVAPRKT